MIISTVFYAAVALSASRFGPNNIVLVEAAGDGARITAYGDTQVVKILAQDFEVEDCLEVMRDGMRPGRCLFSEGEVITLSQDPNGIRMRFQGVGKDNFVEFVAHPRERERAAKALETR